jgi:hypothetical protein
MNELSEKRLRKVNQQIERVPALRQLNEGDPIARRTQAAHELLIKEISTAPRGEIPVNHQSEVHQNSAR